MCKISSEKKRKKNFVDIIIIVFIYFCLSLEKVYFRWTLSAKNLFSKAIKIIKIPIRNWSISLASKYFDIFVRSLVCCVLCGTKRAREQAYGEVQGGMNEVQIIVIDLARVAF